MTWYAWAQDNYTFKHSTRQSMARFSIGTEISIDVDFNIISDSTFKAVRRIIKRGYPIPSDSTVNLHGAHIIYKLAGYRYEHFVDYPNPYSSRGGVMVVYRLTDGSALHREKIRQWAKEAEPMCLLLGVKLSTDSFSRFIITNEGSRSIEPISLLLKKHPFTPPEVTKKALLLLDSRPKGKIVYKSSKVDGENFAFAASSRLTWSGNFFEQEAKINSD